MPAWRLQLSSERARAPAYISMPATAMEREVTAMRSLEQWELVARVEHGLMVEQAARIARRGELPASPHGLLTWPARLWSRLAHPNRPIPAIDRPSAAPVRSPRAPARGTTCPHLRRTAHTAGTSVPAGRRAKAS